MSKQLPHLTDAEIHDVHFDFDQVVEIAPDATTGANAQWQVVDSGSDEHIAFLEQVLRDLQAALADLKAKRAARAH